MPDWTTYPVQDVPLGRIVFPCHDLDPTHIHPIPTGVTLTTGPIHLQALLDGSLFVHDGRHRVLRARHAGHATIPARVHP